MSLMISLHLRVRLGTSQPFLECLAAYQYSPADLHLRKRRETGDLPVDQVRNVAFGTPQEAGRLPEGEELRSAVREGCSKVVLMTGSDCP